MAQNQAMLGAALCCLLLSGMAASVANAQSCPPCPMPTTQPSNIDLANLIDMLTSDSIGIRTIAKTLTVLNGPLLLIGQGPFVQILSRFGMIATTGAQLAVRLVGSVAYPKADQGVVCTSAIQFIKVHQDLLSVLIGRAGLFSTVPLIGQPVAAILRTVEAAVDTLAFRIVALIPGCAADVMKAKSGPNGLDITFAQAIAAYGGAK